MKMQYFLINWIKRFGLWHPTTTWKLKAFFWRGVFSSSAQEATTEVCRNLLAQSLNSSSPERWTNKGDRKCFRVAVYLRVIPLKSVRFLESQPLKITKLLPFCCSGKSNSSKFKQFGSQFGLISEYKRDWCLTRTRLSSLPFNTHLHCAFIRWRAEPCLVLLRSRIWAIHSQQPI